MLLVWDSAGWIEYYTELLWKVILPISVKFLLVRGWKYMEIWMTDVHIKWVYFKENILALFGDNNPGS